jgi:hypothetical protein
MGVINPGMLSSLGIWDINLQQEIYIGIRSHEGDAKLYDDRTYPTIRRDWTINTEKKNQRFWAKNRISRL